MANTDKVRENRLRRVAERRGLRLNRNPRRDVRAVDYGSYMLTEPATGALVADFGWDHPAISNHLDAVEEGLNAERPASSDTQSSL